jgi:hypothetical protein
VTYNAIVAIANSQTLRLRIQAAAAEQNITNPDQWVQARMWQLAASPGWADKWVSALESTTVNSNPDIGQRDDVVTDGDILAAVQALAAAP